jgi:hypothetical protein
MHAPAVITAIVRTLISLLLAAGCDPACVMAQVGTPTTR